jgi:hypothetical protein
MIDGNSNDKVPVVCNYTTYELALLWRPIVDALTEGDIHYETPGSNKAIIIEDMKHILRDRIAVFEWVDKSAEVEELGLCASRQQWFDGLMAEVGDVKKELKPLLKINFANAFYKKYKTFVANGFLLLQSYPAMLVSDAALRVRRVSVVDFYQGFSCVRSKMARNAIVAMVKHEQQLNQLLEAKGLPKIHLVELYVREQVAAYQMASAKANKPFKALLESYQSNIQRYCDDFEDLDSAASGGGGAAVPTRSGAKVRGRSSSKKDIMHQWSAALGAIDEAATLSARITAAIKLADKALTALNTLVQRRHSRLRMHKCLRSGQAEQLVLSFLEVAIHHLRIVCSHYDQSLLGELALPAAEAGGGVAMQVARPADLDAMQYIKDKLGADYGERGVLQAVTDEITDRMPARRRSASGAALGVPLTPIQKEADGSGADRVEVGTPEFLNRGK